MIQPSTLIANYHELLEKITRTQRPGQQICFIAVSKTQPVEAIECLYHLGHRDFGENYVQELCEKATELVRRGCVGIRWHFIGHLQSKKVKALIPHVYCIHTVDSQKLALEIQKRFRVLREEGTSQATLPVFIEVNIDHEASKSGILPTETMDFANVVSELKELSIQGLMCIPALDQDPRVRFSELNELEKQCRPYTRGMLSMGMSDDFEIAIQEGATHIRVGSALFGKRIRQHS